MDGSQLPRQQSVEHIEAFAVHGHGAIGGMLPKRDLTQISRSSTEFDRFWVCTAEGHLGNGSVFSVNGRDYRLTLEVSKAAA